MKKKKKKFYNLKKYFKIVVPKKCWKKYIIELKQESLDEILSEMVKILIKSSSSGFFKVFFPLERKFNLLKAFYHIFHLLPKTSKIYILQTNLQPFIRNWIICKQQ